MLKGIIFDMDGTITLSEPLHHKSFSAVFGKYGITDYTFEEEVKKYSGSGSRAIFTKVFEDRGVKILPEELEECIVEKKKLFKKFVQELEIPVVMGARDFIKKIHAQGLKKIIATGNSDLESVRFILNGVGLLEYFPDLLSVIEVPRGKPFPDIFIEAAKRIGCALNECVVLEDSINGVLAAKAAGIRCIALATTTAPKDLLKAGADLVVKDYNEITEEMLGI